MNQLLPFLVPATDDDDDDDDDDDGDDAETNLKRFTINAPFLVVLCWRFLVRLFYLNFVLGDICINETISSSNRIQITRR